jgi:hypothetical protein
LFPKILIRELKDGWGRTPPCLAQAPDEFIKEHKRWQEKALTPEKRDRPLGASEANRILVALGVGKQSPQYKRVKAVLDQFVNEV